MPRIADPITREAAVAQATFLGQEGLGRLLLPADHVFVSTPPRTLPMCQPGAIVRIDIDPAECRLAAEQADGAAS